MQIPVACPACNMPLQLPDNLPGRSFQCARCSAQLTTAAGGQLVLQARPGPAPNPFAEYPAQPQFGPPGYHPSFYGPPLLSREAALAKVHAPAIVLQLAGAFCVVCGLALPLILLAPDVRKDEVAIVVVPVISLISLAAGGFTAFCGLRMIALRSYALVMTAVVVLLVLGLLVCPLAALPGIWPLIVLLDSGVKANFNSRQAGESPFSGS
jgi:hypothetical protein